MSSIGIKNMISVDKKSLCKGPLSLALIDNNREGVSYNTLVTVANKVTLAQHRLYANVKINNNVKEENTYLSRIPKASLCEKLVVETIRCLVEADLNKDIGEEVYVVTDVVLYAINETVVDGYYLTNDPELNSNQITINAKQVLSNDFTFRERDIHICELPKTPFSTTKSLGSGQYNPHRATEHERSGLIGVIIKLLTSYAEDNSSDCNEPHWFKFSSQYPLGYIDCKSVVSIYTGGSWKTFIGQ